jgi:hypothetical protein
VLGELEDVRSVNGILLVGAACVDAVGVKASPPNCRPGD